MILTYLIKFGCGCLVALYFALTTYATIAVVFGFLVVIFAIDIVVTFATFRLRKKRTTGVKL